MPPNGVALQSKMSLRVQSTASKISFLIITALSYIISFM
jgi:hypothetical protein